jgi:tetratricopeptide (TPR) repeat protein
VGKTGQLLPLMGIAVHSSADPDVRAEWLLRWAEEVDPEGEEQDLGGKQALDEGLRELAAALAASTLSPQSVTSGAIGIANQAWRRSCGCLRLKGLDLAIAAAEPGGNSSELSRCWYAKGECVEEAGSLPEAVECYRSAVSTSPRGENPGFDLKIIGALLDTERALDQFDHCTELFRLAAEVVDEAAVSDSVEAQEFAEGALEIARLAVVAGNLEVALGCYERVRQQLALSKDHLLLGALWHEVAGVFAAEEEGERAVWAYGHAYKHKAEGGDLESQIETLLDLAEAELKWGDEEGLERAHEDLSAALGTELAGPSHSAELEPLLTKVTEKLVSWGQAETEGA